MGSDHEAEIRASVGVQLRRYVAQFGPSVIAIVNIAYARRC